MKTEPGGVGRSREMEYVEVYVATEGDPGEIQLGGEEIRSLVEQANGFLERRGENLRLRTVTDPLFRLESFASMDWRTEKRFRESLIGLCIIDGRHFKRRLVEIFTIRAHHFPPAEDYPGYCIVFPNEVVESPEAARDAEVLERIIRCRLIEPTRDAFHSFVRTLRMIKQLTPDTLRAVFFQKELTDS